MYMYHLESGHFSFFSVLPNKLCVGGVNIFTVHARCLESTVYAARVQVTTYGHYPSQNGDFALHVYACFCEHVFVRMRTLVR